MTEIESVENIKQKEKKMFVIEKNVKMPAWERGRKGGSKYPVDQLEVGDSFFLPKKSLRGAIYAVAKKAQVRLATRAEGKGIRVWRVA